MKSWAGKFILAIMSLLIAIVIIPNITYADSDLLQNKIDIPSDWAKEDVNAAIKNELVPDRVQGEYKKSITREEFSEIAVKLYESISKKKPILPEENPFLDTQNTEIIIANKLGIIKGKEAGIFAPDDIITREEISVILYRTLQAAKPGYDYSEIQEYIFTDQDEISPWAYQAVAYLYCVEIVNGLADNNFNPKGEASRQEAIVLAERMYEKVLVSERNPNDTLIVSRGGSIRRESDLKSELKSLISQELGKPYKWGGTGPYSYDCSGLVYSLFGKLGISLPRTSKSQAKVGTYVSKDNLLYGDLVFFAKDGANVNHVGIYIGNGNFVHAPSTGDVVKISTLTSGYYANCYYTARRILP